MHIILEADHATTAYMPYVDLQGDDSTVFASILHYMPTVIHCREPRGMLNQDNNIHNFPIIDAVEAELRHLIEAIQGAI